MKFKKNFNQIIYTKCVKEWQSSVNLFGEHIQTLQFETWKANKDSEKSIIFRIWFIETYLCLIIDGVLFSPVLHVVGFYIFHKDIVKSWEIIKIQVVANSNFYFYC